MHPDADAFETRPPGGTSKLPLYRPDLTSMDSVDEELRTEILNAIVFAGDDVLRALVSFINDPTYDRFTQARYCHPT